MNKTEFFLSEMVRKQVMMIFCLLSQSSERWKKMAAFFRLFQKSESAKILPLKVATVDPPIGFWPKTGVWQIFLRTSLQNTD